MPNIPFCPPNLFASAFVIIAQVVIAYGLSTPGFHGSLADIFARDAVVLFLVTLAATLFGSLLPASIKHQLVYLRLKDPLPQHRFLQIAEQDPRIDLLRLKQQVLPLLQFNVTQEQQNRLWSQLIYHPHQNAPLVKSAQQAFLFWRDSVVVSFFTGLLLAVGVHTIPAFAKVFSPMSFLVSVLFVLITGFAAQHYGKRIVTNAVVLWLLKPGAWQSLQRKE